VPDGLGGRHPKVVYGSVVEPSGVTDTAIEPISFEREEEESDAETNQSFQRENAPVARPKRGRVSELEEEDEYESSYDRRKFIGSVLPWAIKEVVSPTRLSVNLERTNAILDNISRDIKAAKRSLFNCASRPQFPEAEWINILSGRAVDMDHVFSNLYAVVHDDRRVEKIGELKISVGRSNPVKFIRNHGDWVIS
jgi:hypothetical protein